MKRETNLIEIYNMYHEQDTRGVAVTNETAATELLSYISNQLKSALDTDVNEFVLFETGQLNLEKDCPVTQQLRENYVHWLLETATV